MIRINLLPVRVSKKKTAGKQQLLLFALLVVLGLVGNFIWASSRASELAAREAKVKSLKDEIAQLDRIIGEVKDIKDQQAQLREKLDILQQLKANRSGPVRVLDALASLTPKRLWLTKMEERAGVVAYSGSASTIDDVSEFMSALKQNPHFGNVELQRTTAKTEKGMDYVDFTLTASLFYGPRPASAPPGAPAPAGGR
ncbi:MAG TPA: PilN domain-containing protein [Anaeromyxobacter sp.]|nr:PilN domain-containing protein [Anaeromyxobacter sp.]